MTVELLEPDFSHWGPLTTEIFDADCWPKEISDTLADEVTAFYDSMLVPEMVCGGGADRPPRSWFSAENTKLVTTRAADGTLLGCWFLRGSNILYPCLNVMQGVPGLIPIFRALSYKSYESEGGNLWAITDNPMIQECTNYIADHPEAGRPEGMPHAKFVDNRVEWN